MKLLREKIINSQNSTFGKALRIIAGVAPMQLALLFIIILMEGAIPAVSIKITSHIIDQLARLSGLGLAKNSLVWLCTLWAGILLLRDLLGPIAIALQGNIADKAVFFINKAIISKANAIEGLAAFEAPEFHDTVQILQSQSYHRPLNLVVNLIGLARDLVIILSCLILLSSAIGWIALLALFCSYIHFRVFSLIQERNWQESLNRSPKSREMSYLSSLAINPLTAKEARFFKVGEYLLSIYSQIFSEVYRNISKLRLEQILWPILPFALAVAGNLVAFIYITNQAFEGLITIGVVTLTLQSLAQLHISLASFGEQAGWLKSQLFFFEKYFEFLNCDEKVFKSTDSNDELTKISAPLEVEFKGVSFSYPGSPPILRDVSFKLKAGEKIALVGENGSGKTTLIKLFCGLYAPTKGQILINGTKISKIDPQSLRDNIAPVFQDFGKFSFTIEKNITLSSDDLDEVKIRRIIEEADLNTLPKDLQQKLGKDFGGMDLSGGQWQKIALARALYKDSEIYVLDEPTAALDPISEYEIYQRFKQICRTKTMLFVTHRLGSIMMADRILLLDQGRLVAEGSHFELMRQSSLYNKMFSLQAENYLKLSWR